MTPLKERYIVIKHKVINGEPFLDFTVFEEGKRLKKLDTTTLRPTENMTIPKLIEGVMYGDDQRPVA